MASSFNEKIGIDGVIVTKLDGDTSRWSCSFNQGSDRKTDSLCWYGGKTFRLEQFYPDRMASRILGMGRCLVSLIEKVGEDIDEEKAKEMSQKLKKAQFDFEDYLESMKQMKKMGGLANIMSMMPGLGGAKLKRY